MAKATLASLLLAITLISGCGAPQNTDTSQIRADQVFANKAETWTFQNAYGDISTIEVIRVDSHHTTWHYTKTATRAYWSPGVEQAEIWFYMEKDPDGGWYSTGGVVNMPFGDFGSDPVLNVRYPVSTQKGYPRPYLILPAQTAFSYVTQFDDIVAINGQNLTHIPNQIWRTASYTDQCDTPVYKGPCLVSDQWEGTFIHEKWWFAPGVGLVKVAPLWWPDPNITMVRIR